MTSRGYQSLDGAIATTEVASTPLTEEPAQIEATSRPGSAPQADVHLQEQARPETCPPRVGTGSSVSSESFHLAPLRTAVPRPPTTGRPTLNSDRSYPSFSLEWEKLKTVASPSTHDVLLDRPGRELKTKRTYDYAKQRRRLWRLSIGECAITVILCLAIFGLLRGYSQQATLDAPQKRMFNALSTGLSIALGVNLTSSLRSYAKMLRWRLLGSRYRSLTQFELLMGAERQTNVFKLFWTEFFRDNRRYKILPSGTQLLCVLWIMINLALMVLVAMLGLTYNLDQSNTYINVQRGNVSVIDFSFFDSDGLEAGLNQIQQWASDIFVNQDPVFDLSQSAQDTDTWESNGQGLSRYWFSDFNPDDIDESYQTPRYVDAMATCTSYEVVEGNLGLLDYVVYKDGPKHVKVNIYDIADVGGVLFISNKDETCGERCTTVRIFQVADDASDVNDARFYICNNTVSQVQNLPSSNAAAYMMADRYARLIAGAVGWTGDDLGDDTNEYQFYDASNSFTQLLYSAYNFPLQPVDAANIVSGCSMAGLSLADDAISPARKTILGDQPIYADYLKVKWWYTGTLLVIIPCLHLISLAAVIIWAAKAVIKDDSFLSAAKLYESIIHRLDGHGCLMRGDQIIEKLDDPVVIYGWQKVAEDLRHVDVFERGDERRVLGRFEHGDYDGRVEDVRGKKRLKIKTD